MFGIAFKHNEDPADTLYYTGKAGPEWLSRNPEDAFCAYNETHARNEGWRMKGRSYALDGYTPTVIKKNPQFVVESDGGHTD